MPLSTETLIRAAKYVKGFEGSTQHIYLDTEGNATFGIGFRPPLDKYIWRPNLQAAQADLIIIESLRSEGVHPASWYFQHTTARLDSQSMMAVLMSKLDGLAISLNPMWQLYALPLECQLVLLDMAYNLGIAGLNKYKKLHAAIIARDYNEAANQCARRGISTARNDSAKQLLISLCPVV